MVNWDELFAEYAEVRKERDELRNKSTQLETRLQIAYPILGKQLLEMKMLKEEIEALEKENVGAVKGSKEGEELGKLKEKCAELEVVNQKLLADNKQIKQMEESLKTNLQRLLEENLHGRFQQSLNNIAAVSLEVGYPTTASIPHSVANAFKNLLAIAAETDIHFKEAEQLKEYLCKLATMQLQTETKKQEIDEGEESDDLDSLADRLFGGEGHIKYHY